MSFDKEIGAPYTIASLPRPIASTNERTQAAVVYSITGTTKRKRTEIAVAVDGEGILIYSLQNPQLATSYALPPQTSFTTAPCSIYRRGTSDVPSSRFTYAATTQSVPSEKPRLVCFKEEKRERTTSDAIKSSYPLSDAGDNVKFIGSIPISTDDASIQASHDVLVVFESGHVKCLSAGLEQLHWDGSVRPSSSTVDHSEMYASSHVEYVNLTTGNAAIRGLLRNREDIVALLDPSPGKESGLLDLTQVLCVITRPQDAQGSARTFTLYHLPPRSPDAIGSHSARIKHLVSWKLPQAASPTVSTDPSYILYPATGVLHQLTAGVVISYDFSRTIPKLYSELKVPGFDAESFIRVSSDTLLVTSQDSGGLFDVKYNSVQKLFPFHLATGPSTDNKKRRILDPKSAQKLTRAPVLISYFAESSLAVAITGQEIVALQIPPILSRKRVRTTGPLLVHSIGKGLTLGKTRMTSGNESTTSDVQGQAVEDGAQKPGWNKKMQKLSKYASKGKVAEFEELLAEELGINLAPADDNVPDVKVEPQLHATNDTGPCSLVNGAEESTSTSHDASTTNAEDKLSPAPLRKWLFPSTSSNPQRHLHRPQAIYALSKIFQWREPQLPSSLQAPLKIDFFPPNVFEWLLVSGHLTKETIRRSIVSNLSNTFLEPDAISDGDIVKALVEFDSELHILSAVLNHAHFLPVGEVVQAIKHLLQDLNDHPKMDRTSKLLTNGNMPSEDEMDLDLVSELEAATHDLEHAISVLDNGVNIRRQTLRPALIRLHTFPSPVVTSALRSILPRRDLESLIQLLHLELRNGGWTSPYNFIDPSMSHVEMAPDDVDNQAVAIIASLLSCTLDAIGTGAWLATIGDAESEESTEDVVQALHEETTLALNGFWEARFMKGLLSEFLRFAANTANSQKPTNARLQKQGKPFAAESAVDELPMLPLGGKADVGIEKMKKGKGGQMQQRSAREMGMLISKRVPRYSFERIVI